MDSDAEIDPDLFLKCRLCVAENGSFRIHKTIKEQIKYCLDLTINVDDSLSQLVCKVCRKTITEYSEFKKNVLKNQEDLSLRLLNSKEKDQESEQEITAKKTNNLDLFESSASESEVSKEIQENTVAKESDQEEATWHKTFDLKYRCRFCTLEFITKDLVLKHVKTHSNLYRTKNNIVKSHCIVQMPRIDDRPNLTGDLKTVVLNHETIVLDKGSTNYYVKCKLHNDIEVPSGKRSRSSNRSCRIDDTSDEDDIILSSKSKKRAKKRSERSSSNDTVVLDNDNKKDTNKKQYMECIDIDDSSDSSDDRIELPRKNKSVRSENAFIQNISGSINEKMLITKFLSVGRKVMHKTGIAVPGIMSYLQHLNVNIKWIPTKIQGPNIKKELEYVRIFAFMQKHDDDEYAGWSPLVENMDLFKTKTSNKRLFFESGEMTLSSQEMTLTSPEMTLTSQETTPTCQDILPDDTFNNKLLNENPVANPKQLPKKNNTHKTENSDPKPADHKQIPTLIPEMRNSPFVVDPNENDGMSLPIITSTTSLAHFSKQKPETLMQTQNDGSNVPRIKCKPVSELMARPEESIPIAPNFAINFQQNVGNSETATNVLPEGLGDSDFNKGIIYMNSIDLPNTSALKPIEYFKKILLMHGIILLSQTNVSLNKDFVCLVKFRLDVSQKDKSVILSLALFVHNNCFCLKLKNAKGEISIDSLPAYLQMHILRAFHGAVTDKILSASVQISKYVSEQSRKFVNLLKNIDFKTVL